jgi:hypothetical protein
VSGECADPVQYLKIIGSTLPREILVQAFSVSAIGTLADVERISDKLEADRLARNMIGINPGLSAEAESAWVLETEVAGIEECHSRRVWIFCLFKQPAPIADKGMRSDLCRPWARGKTAKFNWPLRVTARRALHGCLQSPLA